MARPRAKTLAQQKAFLKQYAEYGVVTWAAESYGEGVTMREHSLLTAQAAEQAGAPNALVAACLLHDIGHFLEEADDAYGVHDHGDTSGDYLARFFPASVSVRARLREGRRNVGHVRTWHQGSATRGKTRATEMRIVCMPSRDVTPS